jgi:Protein of unknown function DUF72
VALDEWAARIAAWVRGNEPADAERIVDSAGKKLPGRDVWIYFDNDMKVKAPVNAKELMGRMDELLGRGTPPAAPSEAPAGIASGADANAGADADAGEPAKGSPKKPRKAAKRGNARKKL